VADLHLVQESGWVQQHLLFILPRQLAFSESTNGCIWKLFFFSREIPFILFSNPRDDKSYSPAARVAPSFSIFLLYYSLAEDSNIRDVKTDRGQRFDGS
jgi:hypothetical protein